MTLVTDERARLARLFEACQVVVNAAGLATPDASATPDLFGANGLLPGLAARAAADAGVRRLVHVSSAAVQGRRDPLDETMTWAPFSPYSASKVLGEQLLRSADARPPEVIAYRPTSVLAPHRPLAARLVFLLRLPAPIPTAGGDVPLPTVLLENVGEAIALLATAPAINAGVALHPSEGITLRGLRRLVQGRLVIVPVPPQMASAFAAFGHRVLRVAPRGQGLWRRLEMLMIGQRQHAVILQELGFAPVLGQNGYRRLASGRDGSDNPFVQ